MAFIMLIILIAFTIISYFFGKRSFVSPWFLLCLIFLVTFSLLLLNYNNWNINICWQFTLYVVSAIVAFGLGCCLVNYLSKSLIIKPNCDKNCSKVDYLGRVIKTKYPVNLFLIATILLALFYIIKILSDAGAGGSFTDKLRRIYEKGNEYSPGFVFNQCREIITAIAYLNTFRLLIRFYSKSDSVSFLKLCIPIFVFLIVVLISTERNFFLRYAIYFLCVWVLVYKETHDKKNINLKIFVHAVVILAVVVVLFFIMGKAKQYKSDFFRMVSIYAGSGLNDFNLWIKDYDGSLMLGQSTFTTFNGSFGSILKIFGIRLEGTVSQFDPFIEYVSPNGYYYSSNIYTSLKPYVEDFGYFGVTIIPFLVGMFYQWLFNKTEKKSFSFAWIIYGMLIYSIIYFPIGEQLFRRFHLGLVYEVFWAMIIYWFVFKRKKTNIYKTKTTENIEKKSKKC
ncbi:MAG: oligosaccharide repeat unit polymerase [Roseburia sp.]|nr:oligosaccharide repeat unit polymerase [Roseburia sp.]